MVLLLPNLIILGSFLPLPPPLLLLLLFLLVVPILLLFHTNNAQKMLNLPPGPRRLPVIGNLHQLGEQPHRSFTELAKKHGPLLYLRLGSIPTIFVSSLETATEVLKTQDLAFCDRPPAAAMKVFSYDDNDIACAPYSEQWRQAKRLANLEIFGPKRVESFRVVREEEVDMLMRTISRASLRGPVNLGEMIICLYNNIIGREVFSRRISDDKECARSKHEDLLQEMTTLMAGFCIGDFFPSMEWLKTLTGWQRRLDSNFRAMNEFLEKEIEAHVKRRGGQQTEEIDFCDILLGLEEKSTLTRDQTKGILMNMFLGGTETSASTLEWVMAELARNPRVMRKAQEEVRKVVGAKGKVEESDLNQIPYLRLVLKENFRMHPLSLLPRWCRRECKINGYDIPNGAYVFVNAWAIGRDPEYWEKPEEFWPERFEDSSVDFKGQHMLLLPFGAGRRMCPGLSLGSVGLELALANLLYRFNWRLPDGVDDVDMTEYFGLAIRMKTTLVLKAIAAETA